MRIEHLDDLPILGNRIDKVDLVKLIDTHFPDHGHWKGISGGKVTMGWLLYILSEGDHRLSHVEDWAALRLQILSAILEEPDLRNLDFCDDRLGRLLDRFSDDERWKNFEQAIGKKVLQVYQIEHQDHKPNIIRSDSFNAPQYRESGELYRFGYSKQRRSDQPFCKVMMAAIDPLAVPLAVDVVKGSGPDVDHYLPLINKLQLIMERGGNLYVADSQLGSMPNRTAIHLAGDYYLCPLSKKQVSMDQLSDYLDEIKIGFDQLPNLFTEPESKRKPAYFHQLVARVKDEKTGTEWMERRILVYSPDYAKGLMKSFNGRLNEAQEKIQNLVIFKRGRRNPKTLKDLHARIGTIIKQYKVEDCFEIQCHQTIETRNVQRHKNRPEQIREKIILTLTIKRNEAVIQLKQKKLGWQLYGTNVPQEILETAELVKTYRDEYRIEHLFDYMINRDVGLLPIYLKKEERVKGLIRLLSLAMKFSMLIQHDVRSTLKQTKQILKRIYPGNKSRATKSPTTTLLLRAFKGISVAWFDNGEKKIIQMTPLNEVQKQILQLLKIPDAYQHPLKLLETEQNLRET